MAKMVQDWCNKQSTLDGVTEENGIKYFETSAKENVGVQDAFKSIAALALSKKAVVDTQDLPLPQTINIRNETPNVRQNRSDCAC